MYTFCLHLYLRKLVHVLERLWGVCEEKQVKSEKKFRGADVLPSRLFSFFSPFVSTPKNGVVEGGKGGSLCCTRVDRGRSEPAASPPSLTRLAATQKKSKKR